MRKLLAQLILTFYILLSLSIPVFASPLPMLTWNKVAGAVAYELELLTQPPESGISPLLR